MTNEMPLKAVWSEIAEEVAGIGFWRMDFATGVVDWSPNMFRLFEFPFGPAPNAEQTMSRIHPDDRADAYIDLSSNLQVGGHITISRILLPSGGVRVVESRTLAQRDALGEVISIVGSVQDITDRAARERRLVHGNELTGQGAFQPQSMAADLSHEMRTPLMAIIGYAHLLMARKDMPEAARRDLENLNQSGHALLSVANTVLGRAKAATLAATAAAPVAIGALVDNVLDVFSQQAALKAIALRHIADADFPAFLETHADALTQILINLVGNALKFTDRGSITVSTDYDAHFGTLSIVVADTGRGFDSATREALFQRFFQGVGASALPSGTGLGLSICKGLVEALEGSIEVESAPGLGARFTVRLHAQEAAAPSSADSGRATAKVLIIDDHPANREIAARILADAGALVVAAETASAGLEAASAQPFDLILLDLNLPDMTGAEVARAIQSGAGPNVLTRVRAFTAADIEATSLPQGFARLLKKPYDPVALVELAFGHQ